MKAVRFVVQRRESGLDKWQTVSPRYESSSVATAMLKWVQEGEQPHVQFRVRVVTIKLKETKPC